MFQVQVGNENFKFVGNRDSTSTVTVDMPYPLLSTRLRVYPLTYQSGIEMIIGLAGYTDGKTYWADCMAKVYLSGQRPNPGLASLQFKSGLYNKRHLKMITLIMHYICGV